jgi:hypothetical protein
LPPACHSRPADQQRNEFVARRAIANLVPGRALRYLVTSEEQARSATGGSMKRLIKLIVTLLVVMVAAVVIIPLVVLAGLFIWLKLTEEVDDEALELEELGEDEAPA